MIQIHFLGISVCITTCEGIKSINNHLKSFVMVKTWSYWKLLTLLLMKSYPKFRSPEYRLDFRCLRLRHRDFTKMIFWMFISMCVYLTSFNNHLKSYDWVLLTSENIYIIICLILIMYTIKLSMGWYKFIFLGFLYV